MMPFTAPPSSGRKRRAEAHSLVEMCLTSGRRAFLSFVWAANLLRSPKRRRMVGGKVPWCCFNTLQHRYLHQAVIKASKTSRAASCVAAARTGDRSMPTRRPRLERDASPTLESLKDSVRTTLATQTSDVAALSHSGLQLSDASAGASSSLTEVPCQPPASVPLPEVFPHESDMSADGSWRDSLGPGEARELPAALLVARAGTPLLSAYQARRPKPKPSTCVAATPVGPATNLQPLHASDLARLLGNNTWLNDEVINFYMLLITGPASSRKQAVVSAVAAAASNRGAAAAAAAAVAAAGLGAVAAAGAKRRATQQRKESMCTAIEGDPAAPSEAVCVGTVAAAVAAPPPPPAIASSKALEVPPAPPGDFPSLGGGHILLPPPPLQQPQQQQNLQPKKRLCSVFAFNSFFFSTLTGRGNRKCFKYDDVRRWTLPSRTYTADCVSSRDLLLFPINHGNCHWCLAAIWPRQRLVQYFDSLGETRGTADWVMSTLVRWLVKDLEDKGVTRGSVVREEEAKAVAAKDAAAPPGGAAAAAAAAAAAGPGRRRRAHAGSAEGVAADATLDHSSCGVFACAFAELLARGVPPAAFRFSQPPCIETPKNPKEGVNINMTNRMKDNAYTAIKAIVPYPRIK
ncbi:hypothetical protein VOLCADRAFT_104501 [Volvox carteri f. nagariensis]|uniref:Ubiquitin-like protease family profile domain-containing protein n=1 Tax=Volvox carteri f. nagariensis TaxID=3068 RepID=D8TU10_VOLCA|nr:uncharacterized protein VOLCADRAFT_104501 [Volvox carteri f. nagariensis]EFJ48956.1 hypothetical protein VOLCADRAFT_104501 [Volvox carteri f. nagariensis]|eukprot:XP_002949853.1 hypothetical protein VOLCADRAFT_104501 [Volvox carteri f. nagariensis]